MELKNLQRTERADAIRVSCDVVLGTGHSRPLWLEWPIAARDQVTCTIDPFVVMMLPLAGRLRETLTTAYPVAEILHHNLHEAIAVYHSYFPELFACFDLRLPSERRPRRWGQSAAFYSGGADSLFTIAALNERAAAGTGAGLDQLWIVHGFDIPLADGNLWELVWETLSSPPVIKRMQCHWIRTNVKEDFYARDVPWTLLGFGAALGGVAKSAASTVSRVYIGSWTTYAGVVPHASTPLVDPLWSCETQEIVHFSSRFSREEKLGRLVAYGELLKLLRVCYRNPDGAYNCGRCEKCVRTQLQLRLLEAHDSATSFRWPLHPSVVASVRLPLNANFRHGWQFWRALRDQASIAPSTRCYAQAIHRAMWFSYLQPVKSLARPLKPILQHLGLIGKVQ